MFNTNQLFTERIKELHLFAGAGGGILGGHLLGHRPVCAVEINSYCQKVLLARQKGGSLPRFPIYGDIKEFKGEEWSGIADIVCGGFPCQPFSGVGKKRGEEDERNLWPETARVLGEVGPAIAFLENVPKLLSFDYFGQILGDLAELGFNTEWGVVSAADVGAPHLRERLWLLCWNPNLIRGKKKTTDAESGRRSSAGVNVGSGKTGTKRRIHDVILDNRMGGAGFASRIFDGWFRNRFEWWKIKPRMGRVVHGLAGRMDRLTALGNGQVPAVAAVAFVTLAHRAGLIEI